MTIIRGKFPELLIYIAAGMIFLSAGCRPGFFSYQGKLVHPDQRIELKPASPEPQQWETPDVTLMYSYVREDGRIRISGTADLAEHYQYTFHVIDDFFLYIHFLDPEGRVLQTMRLVSSEHYVSVHQMKFNRLIGLPSGTTHIAFSYRGSMADDGIDRSVWNFWYDPF